MLSRQIARGVRQAARPANISRFQTQSHIARSVSASASRSFTTGEKRPYEPIKEKEVPRSTYEPGAKVQRSTINVQDGKTAETPVATNAEKIVPLTEAMYNSMPPQLQKMTLMNKVVIVTGLV